MNGLFKSPCVLGVDNSGERSSLSSPPPLPPTHPHVCIIRINKTERCQVSSGVFEVFQVHQMKILQQKNEISKNISLPSIISNFIYVLQSFANNNSIPLYTFLLDQKSQVNINLRNSRKWSKMQPNY